MRTGSGDFQLTLDRTLLRPLREQLCDALRTAILDGDLPAGTGLPSTRALAQELSISRDTVVKSFLELEGEGWLLSRQGAGTWVAEIGAGTGPRKVRAATAASDPGTVNLRPGELDPALLDPTLWRRALRRATPSARPADARGSADLRTALARHLSTARALPTSADQLVVCSGTKDALVVLGAAFGWTKRRVLTEEPGYVAARTSVTAAGAKPLLVRVDGDGLDLDEVEAAPSTAAAVLVTPSHQFPLGGRLPLARRQRLLAWAAQSSAVVVEDDYDGEFRFGAPPLPTLASLDTNGVCIYVGSLTLLLDPGLGFAYLRIPAALVDAVVAAREALGCSVSASSQQIVQWMLESGELSRHTARARRIYADRRAVLKRELAELPAGFSLAGLDAGLHAVLRFPPGVPAETVVAAAARDGVLVTSIADCSAKTPETDGLVLGYAGASGSGLTRGLRTVRKLLDEV